MSWAVVRVRGSVNVNPKIKETMKLMKLKLAKKIHVYY